MKNFIRFYVIFSIVTVLFSCSEDNDSEESQIRNGGEVFTSQLVAIHYNGTLQDEYTGVLGAFDINLIKTTDNELVFVVPSNMASGNVSLRIPDLNGLHIKYNIQSTTLLDTPDDTISQMQNKIDLFVNELDIEDVPDISTVQSSFSESFDTLSEEEKEQAALFYQANIILINEILESADFSRLANPELFRFANISDTGLIIRFKASGVFFTAGVALAVLGVEPVEKGIGALVAVVALKKFNLYKREIDSRNLKVFSAKIDGIAADFERNSSTVNIEFVDGQEKTLNFEVDRRDFISSDTDEGVDGIIDYIKSFNLVNTAINKLNQVIVFVNDNLFFSDIDLVDTISENDSTLETTSVTIEVYNGFEFSVTDQNIEISSVSFDNGELKLTLDIINQGLVENGVVNTTFKYTYNDDFNSIAGNFDILITSVVNVFGTWTINESSDCVGTSGTTSTDNYSGPVSLNEDYTVTMEDDSNGNYLSNSFTFENNVLTINTTYQEFFDPICNGVNSRIANYSAQYNYDNIIDTFTGTTQSNQEAISGFDEYGNPCSQTGNSCNGTATLTR